MKQSTAEPVFVDEVLTETDAAEAPAKVDGSEPWNAAGIAILSSVDGDVVHLEIAGQEVEARRHKSLHPLVLEGACKRGEPVLVQRIEGVVVVLGALRTQPTPGIDEAEEYVIEADRVRVRAKDEVSLSADAASVVLRAVGEVETYADRILSRAEDVHKIVGRMLRLN